MHLLAAEGWLELGDGQSANDELDNVTPRFRAHPDVLEIRWEIYAEDSNWIACVDIGKALTQLAPDRAVAWIHHAFALHEMKRTLEAFDVLSPAAPRFPGEPTIPYNLACYTCQLGRRVDSEGWLEKAFALGNAKEIKLQALDDPDLAPLWATKN